MERKDVYYGPGETFSVLQESMYETLTALIHTVDRLVLAEQTYVEVKTLGLELEKTLDFAKMVIEQRSELVNHQERLRNLIAQI